MKNFTDENKNLFVALVLFGAWFALVWFKVPDTGEIIGAIKIGLGAVLFKHGSEHALRARTKAANTAQPDEKGNQNATS